MIAVAGRITDPAPMLSLCSRRFQNKGDDFMS